MAVMIPKQYFFYRLILKIFDAKKIPLATLIIIVDHFVTWLLKSTMHQII